MIRLSIVGRIGGDAIVRDAGGRKVISFSVVHTEKWTNKNGEKEEKSTWVKCSIWKNADASTKAADFIKKGGIILCEGQPSAEVYENKGSLNLNVEKFEILTWPDAAAPAPSGKANSAPVNKGANAKDDDDLPF